MAANVSDGNDGMHVYSSQEHITSTNDTCLFMTSSFIDQPLMLSSTAISNSNTGQWNVPKSDIAGWLSGVLGTAWIFIIRVSFVRCSSITRTVSQTKQHKWSRWKLADGYKECRGPYLFAYLEQYVCATMAINYEEKRGTALIIVSYVCFINALNSFKHPELSSCTIKKKIKLHY